MTAVDTDFDSFIRQQKAKLANERQTLNNEPLNLGDKGRRKWGPPADFGTSNDVDKENYKQLWYNLKGKYLEPSSTRKRWGSPVKLSPRGLLDTSALILDVQKEKERAEYEELWRRQHGVDPTPRGTVNPVGGGGRVAPLAAPDTETERTQREKEREDYRRLWEQQHPEARGFRQAKETTMNRGALDTAQIIRELEREKREEEERLKARNPLLGGASNRAGNRRNDGRAGGGRGDGPKGVDKDEYRRLWEQQNSKNGVSAKPPLQNPNRTKPAPNKKLDTDALIAEITQEKLDEEYKKLWEEKQALEASKRVVRGEQVNDISSFDDSQRNIAGKIAEVKREADEYRRRWDAQHNKGGRSDQRPNSEPADQDVLPLGGYEEYRKRLNEERRREYNDMLRQDLIKGRPNKSAPPRELLEEDALPLGASEEKRRRLREERQREYRDLLQKKNMDDRAQREIPEAENNLPLGTYEENRRKLNEERRREYNEFQKQKLSQAPEKLDLTDLGLAPEVDESEEFGLFHNLGAADKKIKEEKKDPPNQLNLLGQNIVNKSIRRGYQGRPLQEQTDEYKALALGPNDSDAAKLQKIKERNEEYNMFLANKAEKDQNRFADKKPVEPKDGGVYATIPGLRYSNSAQKRREKEAERNREYNDMLRQKAQGRNPPKQGWGTPTYEEMLDKKRAQESQYRRANDIGLDADYHVSETERRIKELEQDLAVKREDLRRKHSFNGILEDPYWLSPRSSHYQYDSMNYQDPGKRINLLAHNQQDDTYYSSLPLGGNVQNDQQRRKEEYKRELQRQMAETAYARKAEREQEILVNNNGIASDPAVVIYEPTRARRKDPAVEAYHTKILSDLNKLDELSPRNNVLGRQQPGAERRNLGGLNLNLGSNQPLGLGRTGGSILDLGFDTALDPPTRLTSMNPPAGLQYQPSTYITANAVPIMNNSIDEAYNFYATRNPLDPELNIAPMGGGGGGAGGGGRDVPSLNLNGIGGGDGGPGSRVRFMEPRAKGQEAAATGGMVFATDDERKRGQRQTQLAYKEELERQMVEKNIKKMKEKEEQIRYEMKMEQEAKTYDPFGKGGGGAPMRDQFGNVISDLRQMRNDNVNRADKFSPRGYGGGGGSPYDGGGGGGGQQAGNTTRAANSYRDDLIGPPPVQTTAEGETSFARGGHGIFGMPKTEAEKVQADKYKLELKRQIEDKKAEEYRKKQLERLEEEKEQKMVEEQRAKMQREYEEEQRKLKEKEDDARRKNEEMMRAAEDKKIEIERRRREVDDLRHQDLREERERERQMAPSPPIPATRRREIESHAPSKQEFTPRAQSADVLNQLAQMRAQLQNERLRVQTMLDDQDDDVEIYDPRQAHRPPAATTVPQARPEVDVFETAMNRNAVAVRRTPGGRTSAERANPHLVEEFNALKHKEDSDSRRQFRQMFPNEPMTSDALETQQIALLRQQEERLRNMKDRRALDDTPAPHMNRDTRTSSSQLHSNSAFVDVNGIGSFPDDFEDLPRRNDSARYRRRTRLPSSPKIGTPDIASRATFGSQSSLNVDKLARKNEDRLRRLRELQGDDMSLYDPEDVLDRFMTKQGHNRPPSRNTLLDDTWMRTGSKQSKY